MDIPHNAFVNADAPALLHERGATPRWLKALIDEGHSVEEFLIGAGRKKKAAAGKKQMANKKGRKAANRKRAQNDSAPKEEAEAAT